SVVASGLDIGALSTRDLARPMVGADLPVERHADRSIVTGQPRLELEDVSAVDDRGLPALKRVHLTVDVAEILGIAGVAGNGQRELAQVVAGLRVATTGRVRLDRADVTTADARTLTRL